MCTQVPYKTCDLCPEIFPTLPCHLFPSNEEHIVLTHFERKREGKGLRRRNHLFGHFVYSYYGDGVGMSDELVFRPFPLK